VDHRLYTQNPARPRQRICGQKTASARTDNRRAVGHLPPRYYPAAAVTVGGAARSRIRCGLLIRLLGRVPVKRYTSAAVEECSAVKRTRTATYSLRLHTGVRTTPVQMGSSHLRRPKSSQPWLQTRPPASSTRSVSIPSPTRMATHRALAIQLAEATRLHRPVGTCVLSGADADSLAAQGQLRVLLAFVGGMPSTLGPSASGEAPAAACYLRQQRVQERGFVRGHARTLAELPGSARLPLPSSSRPRRWVGGRANGACGKPWAGRVTSGRCGNPLPTPLLAPRNGCGVETIWQSRPVSFRNTAFLARHSVGLSIGYRAVPSLLQIEQLAVW